MCVCMCVCACVCVHDPRVGCVCVCLLLSSCCGLSTEPNDTGDFKMVRRPFPSEKNILLYSAMEKRTYNVMQNGEEKSERDWPGVQVDVLSWSRGFSFWRRTRAERAACHWKPFRCRFCSLSVYVFGESTGHERGLTHSLFHHKHARNTLPQSLCTCCSLLLACSFTDPHIWLQVSCGSMLSCLESTQPFTYSNHVILTTQPYEVGMRIITTLQRGGTERKIIFPRPRS